jgi:hypothetical protein
VVVQVVASAVLEADSVVASEEAASQAAGNPCKTPKLKVRPVYLTRRVARPNGPAGRGIIILRD